MVACIVIVGVLAVVLVVALIVQEQGMPDDE
jgi:hypothetical protein